MRFVLPLLVSSLFCFSISCRGDDDGDAEPFDSLQDCVDEHVNGDEGFSPDKSITICCLDHPLGGTPANVLCTSAQASCETYVDAQLDTIASAAQITAGCADYLVQRQN